MRLQLIDKNPASAGLVFRMIRFITFRVIYVLSWLGS
nr:MAG TPA: hypothetical protein [Bacteriophage sp.]